MLSPSAIQRAEDFVGMATATRPLSSACARPLKASAAIATASVRDFMPAIVSLPNWDRFAPVVLPKFPPPPSGHAELLTSWASSARDLVPCRNRASGTFANLSRRKTGLVKTGTQSETAHARCPKGRKIRFGNAAHGTDRNILRQDGAYRLNAVSTQHACRK